MTDKNYWLTEWHIMNALKLIDRINEELSKDVVLINNYKYNQLQY